MGLPWGFVNLWENLEVGEVDMLETLYYAVGIAVATEFAFEELLAVVIKSEIVNVHVKDALVVAFVVFEASSANISAYCFWFRRQLLRERLKQREVSMIAGPRFLSVAVTISLPSFLSWQSCWIVQGSML